MRSAIADLISALKQMNRISKTYIRWGSPLVFASAVLSIFCELAAGTIGVFDNMLILAGELFELFKGLVGAIYVPALIIEIVFLCSKYDSLK